MLFRQKNSKLHEYLVCSNNRDGYDDCINKSSIRYDVLENIVLEAINKKIEKYYDEVSLSKIETKNKKIFSKYKTLESLNRVIIDEFIDKIYIGKLNEETNKRDIEIKWNFE